MVQWLSYGLIMNKVSYEFELCNPWVHHNPNCFNSNLRYNTLTLKFFPLFIPLFSFWLEYIYIYIFKFFVTCMKILVTQKVEIVLFFNFWLKAFNVWFQTNFVLFFLTILKLIILCWNFAVFGVTKKWHWFFKNIFLGKHPC